MKKSDTLQRIIYSFSNISYNIVTDELQKQAKQALKELFEELQRYGSERRYHVESRGHFTYLRIFLPLCESLEDANYCGACHELLTLLHYEPVLQPRLFYPLLWLLSKHIGGELDVPVVNKN